MTGRTTKVSVRPCLPPLPSGAIVLDAPTWRESSASYTAAIDAATHDHLERKTRGQRHPVWDFMFDYYQTSPGKLRRWHPGIGIFLSVATAAAAHNTVPYPEFKDCYRWWAPEAANPDSKAWGLDPKAYWEYRSNSALAIRRLLAATAAHPPKLNCFGLHEWAMVYRDTPRHPEPLRLGPEATNAVVDSSILRCTHIDAYRFFTSEAAPKNLLHPTRATQVELEQPGCLHATMDLYKWAMKLGPIVPGEVCLEAFELACDVRLLDMAASPYDLAAWEVEPVKIETPAGRADYVRRQQVLMQRGQRLRATLIALVDTTQRLAEAE